MLLTSRETVDVFIKSSLKFPMIFIVHSKNTPNTREYSELLMTTGQGMKRYKFIVKTIALNYVNCDFLLQKVKKNLKGNKSYKNTKAYKV